MPEQRPSKSVKKYKAQCLLFLCSIILTTSLICHILQLYSIIVQEQNLSLPKNYGKATIQELRRSTLILQTYFFFGKGVTGAFGSMGRPPAAGAWLAAGKGGFVAVPMVVFEPTGATLFIAEGVFGANCLVRGA